MVIEDIIWFLVEYGLLVFFLIFAVVFAVLQKVKIFGENKKVNVIIALVMGLLVIAPHILGYYPPGRDVVEIINQSIPSVSAVLIAIVMALLIIGVMGARFELGNNSVSGWIAFLAFAIVVYIFGASAGWWYALNWIYYLDDYTMTLIITVLVFALVIWFIVKEDKDTGDDGGAFGKFGKELGDLLKK